MKFIFIVLLLFTTSCCSFLQTMSNPDEHRRVTIKDYQSGSIKTYKRKSTLPKKDVRAWRKRRKNYKYKKN